MFRYAFVFVPETLYYENYQLKCSFYSRQLSHFPRRRRGFFFGGGRRVWVPPPVRRRTRGRHTALAHSYSEELEPGLALLERGRSRGESGKPSSSSCGGRWKSWWSPRRGCGDALVGCREMGDGGVKSKAVLLETRLKLALDWESSSGTVVARERLGSHPFSSSSSSSSGGVCSSGGVTFT